MASFIVLDPVNIGFAIDPVPTVEPVLVELLFPHDAENSTVKVNKENRIFFIQISSIRNIESLKL